MKKKDLLESIRRNRRQLERYIFYFQKNEDGEFVPSHRPKFGRMEMLEPGVYQDWSFKDLLSFLNANTASHYNWATCNIRTTVIRKGSE